MVDQKEKTSATVVYVAVRTEKEFFSTERAFCMEWKVNPASPTEKEDLTAR